MVGQKKNSTGADHVLDNFSNDEKGNVEIVTKNIIESLSILINKEGLEFARIIGSIDFEDKKFVSWIKKYN